MTTIHQDVASWFQGLFEQPSVRIWIAEGGGAAVGYVIALLRERPENVFGRSRRWLEIDQIGVRPGHRRTGIGRALVDVVLEAADDDGTRDVELQTWVFNGGAQRHFVDLASRRRLSASEGSPRSGDVEAVAAQPALQRTGGQSLAPSPPAAEQQRR